MSGFHPKDLIKEVKCRPGIYDKEKLEHPRREHRHRLWLEVAENLTPFADWESYTEVEKDARADEIQSKWKHLRDHFYREIKLVSQGEAHKKRKYVYFDEMEFMRPFVGYKLPPISKINKYNDSLDGDGDITPDYIPDNDDVMEELLKSNDSLEEEQSEPPAEPRRTSRRSVRAIKASPKEIAVKTTPKPTQKLNKDHKEVIKHFDGLKKTNTHPASSTTTSGGGSLKIRDGDISFCLSMVPTFRKLGDAAKLRAKIEMLKILHKYVEHAERTKPPHQSKPTETSNTEEHDMQEDHLEDFEEEVSVKHEENDDPLHASGTSSNTKAWWT